ncbi:hypothetical protein TRAPUB_5855 [Trametes pubescens]|uniref:Uncharacterized protein n=1 Tax=Trametes pubescens TaxID=154538 RepID=A0A1M2V7G5_TRAPU|nr:hypothetical protein TRAPUB_5855 [Trametes pubescens]
MERLLARGSANRSVPDGRLVQASFKGTPHLSRGIRDQECARGEDRAGSDEHWRLGDMSEPGGVPKASRRMQMKRV